MMSVVTRVLQHANARPEHVAVFDKDSRVTYKQLASDIQGLAAQLSENVKPGDAVLVTAVNSYEFVSLYFAIHYLGATVVNISGDADENYKQFIINKIKPALIIHNCLSFFESRPLESRELVPCAAKQSQYADIMFTSGTTGKPKGVPLTHTQLAIATEHIIREVGNDADDVELLLMPLSHSFGMGRMRATLYAGGSLVVGYPLQRLKGVFKAIEKYSVTGFGIVPSAWMFITKMSKNLISRYASQIKYIELGSAYLSSDDKAELIDWFPDTHIVMHYGLTEVSRATFTHLHSDDLQAVGCLDRGAEFVVLEEDGSLAKNGETGEIAFKAPWMISEYFQDEQLTHESFSCGYFKTGDLGKREGDYLYLTGRVKEIINVGGKKVSPYQIEQVLNRNEFVVESACIPCSDMDMGEVVHAYLVLDSRVDHELKSVIERLKKDVAAQLPMHMRPQKYHQIDALPKTANGKIQRSQIALQ